MKAFEVNYHSVYCVIGRQKESSLDHPHSMTHYDPNNWVCSHDERLIVCVGIVKRSKTEQKFFHSSFAVCIGR